MDRSLRPVGLALIVAATVLFPRGTSAAPRNRTTAVFVPVLIYHHVKTLKASDDSIERGLTVLPSQFDAEMRYLRAHHYHVVSARALANHLISGTSLPRKPVVLTFDDGYTDVFPDVYQVLSRMHMVATFFVVPGFLNKPRYLTWKQVQTMSSHGMDIEAHSMTHPDLTSIGPRSVRWQLNECRRELQSRLHKTVTVFAYPYGAHSPAVISDVRQVGYRVAFTTQEGWIADPRRLLTEPRVYVDLDDTLSIFAGRLQDDQRVLAEDPT